MILRNFFSLPAFTVYMENSLRHEISIRSIWPKWNLHRSEFHYTWSHVNADNEVTSHRSEILPPSQTSNQFEFTSGIMEKCSYLSELGKLIASHISILARLFFDSICVGCHKLKYQAYVTKNCRGKTNRRSLIEGTIAKTTLSVLLCPNIVLQSVVQTTTLCMRRNYLSSGSQIN